MMKTIAILACLLSITFAYSYAEVQIPESIKEETKQMYSQNMLGEKTVMSLLVDLSNQKIIKNTHLEVREIPKSFNDIETLLAFISVSGSGSSQTHLWKFQVYCLPGTSNCEIDGN